MESLLVEWLDSSEFPLWSAFILGLMTAISPCPLATNITAIGFIGRDITRRRIVFLNGLLYTLGRTIAYVGLATILYFSLDQFNISGFFQVYGEKALGPLLLFAGLVMLNIIPIKLPGLTGLSDRIQSREKTSGLLILLMGIIFALAFCPYSGVLYFALLIPLTLSPEGGLHLPVAFALATGLPVIILAWLMAFAIGKIGRVYQSIKTFEFYFRKVVAILFLLSGAYLIAKSWLGI